MLIGDGRLHLPAYDGRLPAVVPVRCTCGRRFAVFTGALVIGDGCELVKAQAEANGQQFIDARLIPFMNCDDCGQLLDFSTGEVAALVM